MTRRCHTVAFMPYRAAAHPVLPKFIRAARRQLDQKVHLTKHFSPHSQLVCMLRATGAEEPSSGIGGIVLLANPAIVDSSKLQKGVKAAYEKALTAAKNNFLGQHVGV